MIDAYRERIIIQKLTIKKTRMLIISRNGLTITSAMRMLTTCLEVNTTRQRKQTHSMM